MTPDLEPVVFKGIFIARAVGPCTALVVILTAYRTLYHTEIGKRNQSHTSILYTKKLFQRKRLSPFSNFGHDYPEVFLWLSCMRYSNNFMARKTTKSAHIETNTELNALGLVLWVSMSLLRVHDLHTLISLLKKCRYLHLYNDDLHCNIEVESWRQTVLRCNEAF